MKGALVRANGTKNEIADLAIHFPRKSPKILKKANYIQIWRFQSNWNMYPTGHSGYCSKQLLETNSRFVTTCKASLVSIIVPQVQEYIFLQMIFVSTLRKND